MKIYKAIEQAVLRSEELPDLNNAIKDGWVLESTHTVSWNDNCGGNGISLVFLMSKEYEYLE